MTLHKSHKSDSGNGCYGDYIVQVGSVLSNLQNPSLQLNELKSKLCILCMAMWPRTKQTPTLHFLWWEI